MSKSEHVNRYKQAIESSIIVSVGMLMHLNRISIIELRYSKLPLLIPNAASSLFVFSVLCLFSKLRPLWPQTLKRRQKLFAFLVEICLILYATDFLMRQVWLPCLKLLNFCCHFLGQYIIVANQNFLQYNAPLLSHWVRNDAFYIARFLLAVVVFIFMLDAVGVLELINDKVDSNKTVTFMVSTDDEDNLNGSTVTGFDANDLPYVPPEDLLNIGHRVGARRRKQPSRKSKRKHLLLTNDNDNDYSC